MAKIPAARPVNPFGFNIPPNDPRFGDLLLTQFNIHLVREFQVIEESYEYIVCKSAYNRRYRVAKPYVLRSVEPDEGESESDSVTINGIDYVYTDVNERTASSSGAYDEDQIVTPSYYEDEWITAIRVQTGIQYEVSLENGDTAKDKIEWMDINTAGRQWVVKIVEIT